MQQLGNPKPVSNQPTAHVDPTEVVRSTAIFCGDGALASELLLDTWGRADAHLLLKPGTHVFIEFDLTQKHPSTNVLKYWPWLESKPGEPMLLVHAIAEPPAASPSRVRLARWIGCRMEHQLDGRFQYVAVTVSHYDGGLEGTDLLHQARAVLSE